MPQFRYRAVTHAGEIVVGGVDAPSREEVVLRIEYLGHLTIDAELAGILARCAVSLDLWAHSCRLQAQPRLN
jgi:general secretion pathway protein F